MTVSLVFRPKVFGQHRLPQLGWGTNSSGRPYVQLKVVLEGEVREHREVSDSRLVSYPRPQSQF